ncbi:GNAT family N-acetyltransferase [Pseudooceanicola nanhaiensis]|uniref:GNAT family N-acetyltransferase n=1 Tax=Pseudooceanicola nanhaiensis TaxID=375761 RepID=UPI001CD80FC5|nr:GNAT family N-acetyltransferase [Pseudooceanicola nanhaiensis]MCA0919213.1 N-acetyltransferase family protein [Pseudooceanicola nanhaiensis]
MTITLRPAALPADTDAILAIWTPVIRETTITFASDLKTPATLVDYVEGRRARGREFFVAEEAGEMLGFATYDQFRGGDGYVHAMEHTIILGPQARGRGVGRALMTAVEDHARAAGAHTMVAAVSGENEIGIAFHAALGYDHVGRMPQSGRKFDRWLDLVLMQKIL